MKKTAKLLALVLALVMALSALTACNDSAATTPVEESGDDMVTVTWYNGSEELKAEQVKKGSTLTSWDPSIEGKTFKGWFAEASLSQAFDFATVINEDTDIFAAFQSNAYVEDTNSYYMIGSGAGDMGKSNWDHAAAAEHLTMTKDSSITDANVYTLTIQMYAGDRFQICYGGTWDGQQGIGYIPGAEYADGINPNDSTEYAAADKKYAEVKDADGNVIFIGGDEYNKEYYVWNVILAEGQDGVYKFTYTTYPSNPSYNTIEYELVEKLEAQTTTHDMHIIGSFNEWNAEDTNFPMAQSEDKASWSGFLTITKEMYVDYGQETEGAALKVINHINGTYYGDAAGENIFLPEGDYCIKYNVEDNSVEIQKLGYFIVGTFADAEGKAVNFAVKNGVTPELTSDGTVATGTLEATDITGMNDYSWIKDQGKPGVMAVKVVYGCELGIRDWFSDNANGGDNFYVEAGTYTVTLDIATGTVTVG